MVAMQLAVLSLALMGHDAGPAPCCVVESADPVGRWKGTWESETSGHRGPLRAKIRRCHYGQYRAKFSGRFFGVIPFVFSAPLTATQISPDGVMHLTGERRLPFFGVFHCDAHVTGCEFDAFYYSPNDQGRFQMRRVAPK